MQRQGETSQTTLRESWVGVGLRVVTCEEKSLEAGRKWKLVEV